MPFRTKTHKAYWDSYKLLESQLLRLSHSIYFDDAQIHVYSSELADIVNSACIKIESLAKDIYEEHIWPFQADDEIVPESCTSGKKKSPAAGFKPEKWTRDKWKFDYNCLVEISKKFSLNKRRIELKSDLFNFRKYGDVILPFGNISINDCQGGYWEYSERDLWQPDERRFKAINWCKSYQSIKHNYIQSIPEHGTIENALMVLAAFYLLAVYDSCLPYRCYEVEGQKVKHNLDFGSKLFSCPIWYCINPPCIIDSDFMKYESDRESKRTASGRSEIFADQDLMDDIDGYPFLVTLNKEAYIAVKEMVDEYCIPRGLTHFDIAPYERENGLTSMDEGTALYLKLTKYIKIPYSRKNICISFNIGKESMYESLLVNPLEYEKSKHRMQTAAVLQELKVGDFVDARFSMGIDVSNGEVTHLDEQSIYVAFLVNGVRKTLMEPILNVEYIRKRKS